MNISINPEKMPLPFRLSFYLLGILSVSLGIVLCKKCALGISPVSSIPLILEGILPLSFGMATMLFHLANIILQAAIHHKFDLKTALQVPVAFLFGLVINAIQKLLAFEAAALSMQLFLLFLSVFFTALGMVFMLNMQLVQNPPDGLVRAISGKLEKELGQIKIFYDAACVLLSASASFMLLGNIESFGIGTLVSALAVGKLVTSLNPLFIRCLKKYASATSA